MTTTTEHLKRLAEAAVKEREFVMAGGDLQIGLGDISARELYESAATEETVKALCELVEQMAEALKAERSFGGCAFYVEKRNEVLAAYEAFQKGEWK